VGCGEDEEVEHHRENEVGGGPRERDEPFLPRRLLEEAAAAILGRDLLVGVVAGELDVAAERQKRDAVFGLAPGEAEEARPESDGEPDRLHADGLPHQQVTQLVEENHHADHQRERNQRKPCRTYE
jgi:hypothetical protein